MKPKLDVSISSPTFLFQQNAATQKLKKAWRELENRQWRIQRDMRVERNRLKGTFSTPSVRSLLQDADYDDGGVTLSGTSIPGFRFKANGEPKKSAQCLRQEKLNSTLAVLKKRLSDNTGRPNTASSGGTEAGRDVASRPSLTLDLSSDRDSGGSRPDSGGHLPSQAERPRAHSRHRYSTGNTSGYKVDQRTRHTSCFNIAQFARAAEDANFLDAAPSATVRHVQRQLGLHVRAVTEPGAVAMLGAGLEGQEEKQLERAINVLQMVMSTAEAECSLLELPGENKQRQQVSKASGEHGGDGPAARRRQCEACRHVLRHNFQALVTRPVTQHHIRPRWQIPPSGRLLPAPVRDLKTSITLSGSSSRSKYSESKAYGSTQPASNTSAASLASNKSDHSHSHSAASPKRKALHLDYLQQLTSLMMSPPRSAKFRPAVGRRLSAVSVISEANRPEGSGMDALTVAPAPEPWCKPRADVSRRQLEALRRRNNLESEALKPKVQRFLKTVEQRPEVHPVQKEQALDKRPSSRVLAVV